MYADDWSCALCCRCCCFCYEMNFACLFMIIRSRAPAKLAFCLCSKTSFHQNEGVPRSQFVGFFSCRIIANHMEFFFHACLCLCATGIFLGMCVLMLKKILLTFSGFFYERSFVLNHPCFIYMEFLYSLRFQSWKVHLQICGVDIHSKILSNFLSLSLLSLTEDEL